MRKGILRFMVLLLAAMPFLGVYAGTTQAATSRVAVIKSMSGTVQVKKAGGSKQFKAFTKMSLNEGDVLSTDSGASAVLQFANGTSEDDQMTVAAKSTLTFSKLSDRNGTRTKVTMFNGTSWVDVKSISTKNDEFTLETPTAVMGVRGTHFFVNVDPLTGSTSLVVAAGKVKTQTPASNGQNSVLVYPSQQIDLSSDKSPTSLADSINIINVNEVVSQASPEIIKKFIENGTAIREENNQLLDQLKKEVDQGKQPDAGTLTINNQSDLDRLSHNLDNLLGVLVKEAVDKKKIETNVLQQILDATRQKLDYTNASLLITDEEKKKQEAINRIKEQLRQQKLEQLKLEEEKRDKELQKKLEEQKKQQEEANKKALEDKQKKAQEAYEKQLSDAEKKRFQDDLQKRQQESSGTSAGSNSGGVISNPVPSFYGIIYKDAKGNEVKVPYSSLTSNELDLGELSNNNYYIQFTKDFAANQSISTLSVAKEFEEPSLLTEYETLNPEGDTYWIPLYQFASGTTVKILVSTKEYHVTVSHAAFPKGMSGWYSNNNGPSASPNITYYWNQIGDTSYVTNGYSDTLYFEFGVDASASPVVNGVDLQVLEPEESKATYHFTGSEDGSYYSYLIEGLLDNKVTTMKLTLKHGSESVGQSLTLYYVRGDIDSILNDLNTDPFTITTEAGDPISYDYLIYGIEMPQYYKQIPMSYENIVIHHQESLPWLRPSQGYLEDEYDHEYEYYSDHNGDLHVKLQPGMNEYRVDYVGMEDRTWLKLYRAELPTGVKSWSASPNSECGYCNYTRYWTPVTGLSTDELPRYYIDTTYADSVDLDIKPQSGYMIQLRLNQDVEQHVTDITYNGYQHTTALDFTDTDTDADHQFTIELHDTDNFTLWMKRTSDSDWTKAADLVVNPYFSEDLDEYAESFGFRTDDAFGAGFPPSDEMSVTTVTYLTYYLGAGSNDSRIYLKDYYSDYEDLEIRPGSENPSLTVSKVGHVFVLDGMTPSSFDPANPDTYIFEVRVWDRARLNHLDFKIYLIRSDKPLEIEHPV
uniref:FecR protein domain-containing protein n=2 Tax=Cohnella candidum TaxID=2674991 RepID=A0A3G3JY03_9BACL|nr:hypothetical protein EAV92_11440 [Cohnella candidum]